MELSNDYLAGLFDGEGWFSISRGKGSFYRSKREWAFQCHAALVMREEILCDSFCEKFGGKVTPMKNNSPNHSPYFKWAVTGMNALNFSTIMKEHLVAKKAHAIVVEKFQNRKILNGNRPLPDETYDFYVACHAELAKLNQKGVGK